MWTIEAHDEYLRRAKNFRKRWSREHDAVLDNLDTYLGALNEGANPLQVKLGFVHPEGMGAVAIDERHHGKGKLKATRLYLFPEIDTATVHVITIGDKQSQSNDVKTCHAFIASRRRNITHDQPAPEQRPGPGTSDRGQP
jgi:hypothetical protein